MRPTRGSAACIIGLLQVAGTTIVILAAALYRRIRGELGPDVPVPWLIRHVGTWSVAFLLVPVAWVVAALGLGGRPRTPAWVHMMVWCVGYGLIVVLFCAGIWMVSNVFWSPI